jgi:hypothetical protein
MLSKWLYPVIRGLREGCGWPNSRDEIEGKILGDLMFSFLSLQPPNAVGVNTQPDTHVVQSNREEQAWEVVRHLEGGVGY